MNALASQRQLKDTIRAGEPTLGIFVKTPAIQIVETLGLSGADFIVLDAEHAPFGPAELDRCILAARSVGTPALVRLGAPRPENILQVLDMGAAGIIVPHVGSAHIARAAIDACRYEKGSRGFAGQTRAVNDAALPAAEYRKASDAAVIVIAQIEDADGVAAVDEISAVDELDAIFIGRADLAVSMGRDDINDPAVAAATEEILAAGRKAGMSTGLFLPTPEDIGKFREHGASLFAIATDQSLLIDAARGIATQFRRATGRSS